jgi:hypothetical protein
MTLDEKKLLVAKLKEDYDPLEDEKRLELATQDDEPMSDEEILQMNDTISKIWKAKVLNYLKMFNTADAKASDIKIVADIIDQVFKQNKVVKDKQLWLNSWNENVFQIENANIIQILQTNGLR